MRMGEGELEMSDKEELTCIKCGKKFPKPEEFQIVKGAVIERGICPECFAKEMGVSDGA